MNQYATEEFYTLKIKYTTILSVSCVGYCRGTGDVTPDDPEEHVPTVQDSEINLLKSGEVT